MSLSSRIQVNVVSNLASVVGLASVAAALQKMWTTELADGDGAGEADKIYSLDEQTISDGGTLSLDLAGALEDALGAVFTPARVKAVIIKAADTNTTNLTLFGDAASVPLLNTAATTITLKPGGLFVLTDPGATGYVVTGATADIIKIVNGAGAAAKVSIVVIGASA